MNKQSNIFGEETLHLNWTKLTEEVMNNYNGAFKSDRLLAKGCLEKLGIKLDDNDKEIILTLIYKFADIQRISRKIREEDTAAKS